MADLLKWISNESKFSLFIQSLTLTIFDLSNYFIHLFIKKVNCF